ncbi:MAG: glycoside hydrolase domain-containing protein, partial [Synechococcaceae cyanobacterium]|nr:glycoside hydrolase domain-containing protein [Synechococcaceae cyanobacterium]
QTTGREQADITGLMGQYAHGNEPSHHVGWLYHYAGHPDRSVARVRAILDQLYAARPDGLSGNEDCGQMSSWYVLSSLGLYQVAPGSNQWLLGRPLFDRARIRLDNGESVEIVRHGGASGAHVRSVRWNGKPLQQSWISHRELLGGGRLDIEVGETPSDSWGRAPEDRPSARIRGERALPAPYVIAASDAFDDSLRVELRCVEPGAQIYHTTDPETPSEQWTRTADALVLRESTRLLFFARAKERRSPVLESYLHRIANDWSVEVSSVPNAQYTAGGSRALIDGRRGPDDWRTGMWLGYEDQDFEAVVDLGRGRPIHRVGASFLQDMRSWIWMPKELLIEASVDGSEWYELGSVGHDVPDDVEGIFRRDLVLDVASLFDLAPRFLRFRAINYGTIPAWHPGAGGEAFIFIDEIIIE